uniref:Unplaced genomic scaffold supercont1.28, whole genome shotgun sequence n=1 Tax=Cryptococcus bacillisporus CA1280 TaxID=1296109 RepID=A0A0D0VHW0_CRYGA|nr:hypothetical protein I312_06360 [Cryptococcus bacillisporus CA1280]
MSDQTFEFLEPVIAAEAIVLINEVQQLSSGQSTHQSVDELVRLFCIRVLATLNAKGATLKQESKKLDEANKVMAIHSFLACEDQNDNPIISYRALKGWSSIFRRENPFYFTNFKSEDGKSISRTELIKAWAYAKQSVSFFYELRMQVVHHWAVPVNSAGDLGMSMAPAARDLCHDALGCLYFIIDAMDMLYDWEINHYLPTSWDILPAPLDFRDFAYHLNFTVYDRKTIPDTFISAARHMLSLHEQGYEAKWWDMWCFTNRTAMAYPRFHLPGNLFNDDDIRLRFRRDDGSIEVEGLGDVLSKLVITGPTIVKQPFETTHPSTSPSDGFVTGGRGIGYPHNILRNSETNIPLSFAAVASDKKLSERSTLRRRRITRSPSY